ncbi:unnamed protein product [Calypogeia fissa]
MGKFAANVLINKFRHPVSKDPQPGPPIFVDVKDKDLPFDGQCKNVTPSIFDHPLGLKQEGALLMAILTGVQGSGLEKVTKGAIDLYYLKAGEGEATLDPSSVGYEGVKEKKKKKLNKVDAIKHLLFGGALSTSSKRRKSRVTPHQPHSPPQAPVAVLADAAIDTADLEELTADENALENAQLLEEIAKEEERNKKSLELEAGISPAIPLDEYLKLVKRSTGRIGYRTQLLDELALGEDIDMWVKEAEFPPIPPLPPPEKTKESKTADAENSKDTKSGDPGAKPPPEYKGAMRATSLVVKKARRLAGLMHIEQQNHDLQDVCTWLQHLGSVSVCHPAKIDDQATPPPQEGTPTAIAANTGNGHKGDWRLPTSPAAALLMAQEDLRQRLAQLYEEKGLMETRKDQLDAAKKLVGKNLGLGGIQEMVRISGYLHGLEDLEEGYEMLGGRIAENLDDADKLDKRYRKLNEKAREEEEMKSQKGKKGSKGKKGATSAKLKKDQSGDEADVDEDGQSEGRGKKSRKRRKKTGKYENLGDDVLYGTSEGDQTEDGSKTSKRGKTTRSAKTGSSQGTDVEGKEGKVGTSKQGEADINSGGKKDRKRAKVKETTVENSLQLEGEERVGNKSSGENVQVTKDEMATDREGAMKSKEKQSMTEQQAQPPNAAQLPSRDGHTVDTNNAVASVVGPNGGSLEGAEVNSGDSNLKDLARLNRQDGRTQTRGQQKDFDHDVQEDFEIVNDVVCKPKVPLQDEAVQTDDAILFSLMESMMQEMPNDEQLSGMDDEAAELKRLRREVKKAKMQLRFWRSRNWVERHSRLSPSGKSAHPVVDSPSEVGFSFYFNAVRAPNLVTHPMSYPPTGPSTTNTSGSTSRGDHTTTPIRTREHPVESVRPAQALNAKLMSSITLPAHIRPPRTSRRTSSELQSLSAGSGLVIFGRSSNLVTAHGDPHTAVAHLPTHENRVSRLSPRLSGVQYQKT